jgi:metal-responsive CopG/Arc/MetJ family transcriptional regulator
MTHRLTADNGKKPVTIRVPETLLDEIDECIRKLKVPISRNTWLLEAAAEKLYRVQKGEPRDGTK